jgi:hypothetical protein
MKGIAEMKFAFALAMLVALTTASVATAGAREETVKFEPGTSEVSRTGTIHGYDLRRYFFEARAGQRVRINLKKNKSTCYFVAFGPDSKGIEGALAGTNSYEGILQQSGRFGVNVFLMRVSARRGRSCTFTISIELKDQVE